MGEREPIERHLRSEELLTSAASLVIRGWPLTVDGLLRNADATRRRYSFGGEPFIAISAEATLYGWSLEDILSGPRLRTRRTYAAAPVRSIERAGFELVPTFTATHYSVRLPIYTATQAQRLIDALGAAVRNPHYVRRQP